MYSIFPDIAKERKSSALLCVQIICPPSVLSDVTFLPSGFSSSINNRSFLAATVLTVERNAVLQISLPFSKLYPCTEPLPLINSLLLLIISGPSIEKETFLSHSFFPDTFHSQYHFIFSCYKRAEVVVFQMVIIPVWQFWLILP